MILLFKTKHLLLVFALILIASLGFAQDQFSKKELKKTKKNFLLNDRPWTIEVPIWLPGFAGDFAYGDISFEGEDGGDPGDPGDPDDGMRPNWLERIFSKDWYLKFFFLTRIAYEKNRFIFQLDGISGAVGSSVKFNYNNKEIVQANFRSVNVRLFAGYKIIQANSKSKKFRYELFGYIGGRTHFQKVFSDLDRIISNKLDINFQWIEPIVGIQNQFTFRRWFLVVQGDYGGLFVNRKYSNMLSAYCYYRTGKAVSLKLGWNYLSLNHRDVLGPAELDLKVRLSGPSLGLAFHF